LTTKAVTSVPLTTGPIPTTPLTTSPAPITTAQRLITTASAPITTGPIPTTPITTGPCSCPVTTSGSTTGSVTPPPPITGCPFIDFEDQCTAISFTLDDSTATFSDYQVISFKSFNASTGDVQGRLASRNSVVLGNGYSIGDQVYTGNDTSRFIYNNVRFSLIAGSLLWGSGALSTEEAFVGDGQADVPSYLEAQVTGSCDDNSSDCLEDPFNRASNCYEALQESFANNTDNANYTIVFSQLQITCGSTTDSRYYITIPSDALLSVTYFGLSGCNSNAQWVINVAGNGDVDFHGDTFPTNPDNVLWNILGAERTIFVHTAVNGAILSPRNFLYQTTGVIKGKVVVGDILFALQINSPVCTSFSSSVSFTQVEAKDSASTASVQLASFILLIITILFI